MPYEIYFVKALGITITAEILAGLLLIKFLPKYFNLNLKDWKTYLLIGTASFMTLPYVWFIWPFFIQNRLVYSFISEVWVWLTESVFYIFAFRLNYKKALLFSFALNLFSVVVGLLIKF